ncbi:MAG: serine acetyltransferase [Candidatus Omnitrophica bacterium]|nr:serine acetyltransferase [Candidatus Omnitrophota bacterium]
MKCFIQFLYLREDLGRWGKMTPKRFFYCFFEQGIWATIIYRFTRFLYLINIPILKYLIKLIGYFLFKFVDLFLGVSISPGIEIGPGLYIGHTGCLLIHPEVVAGKNLSIGNSTTIGVKGLGKKGTPIIGDNVYIGVGAKVLGNIRIGNNVRIGANAVVVSDVPDNVTVVGIPAKIVQNRMDDEAL